MSDRTRLEDGGPDSPPTRLEVDTTRLEEPAAAEPRRHRISRVNLPDALAERYEVVRDIEVRGAEADLLVVRHRPDGRLRAAKLYRVSVRPPSDELMTRLESADRAHVVEVFERGDYDGTWCEVMEYCELGSLADLIARNEGRLAPALVQSALEEVATALLHLHGEPIRITHRDLKPANVLVRRLEPLDLVLADFGLATMLGPLSQVLASARRTVAYSAPEAPAGKVSPKLDWWSLGITAVEMLTGERPFRHDTGNPTADEQLASADIATKPVDLAGIEDERLALLCRGLTIKDPDHRWGDAEVREWLAGGHPAVVAERLDAGAVRRVIPFSFPGPDGEAVVPIDDPVELAAAMGVHWGEALACFSDARENLRRRRALRDFLRTAGLSEADGVLMGSDGDEEDRLLRFRLALDPAADPYFRGELLTEERVRALAERAVATGAGQDTVAALLDHGVLQLYSSDRGRAQWGALEARWDENVRWLEQHLLEHRAIGVTFADLQGDFGRRLRARIVQLLLDERAAAEAAIRARRLAGERALRADAGFLAAVQAAGAGPEPARHVFIELAHTPAAAAVAERRSEQRRRLFRGPRELVRECLAPILFTSALLLAGVSVGTELTVFHVPDGNVSGVFMTGLAHAYPAAIAGAVACVLAALVHDAVLAWTGAPGPRWSALFTRLRLAGVLAVAGLAARVVGHYAGGRTAPASTGAWVVLGVAAGQVVAVLGGLPLRRWATVRVVGWALGLAGAAVGIGIGTLGLSHAAAARAADFAHGSSALGAAAPAGCRPVSVYPFGRPPAWLRGEARCHLGPVSVEYIWLLDRHLLDAYSLARVTRSGLRFTAPRCHGPGAFKGAWSGGQLLCYLHGARSYLEWGDRASAVYAIAAENGPIAPLIDWWRRAPQPTPGAAAG